MQEDYGNTFEMHLEDFSPANFTRMARWLGASCSFMEVPHNNEVGLEVGPAARCV